MRSNTISAVCTISSRCFYTCISRTNKPIAITSDMRSNAVCTISTCCFYAGISCTDKPIAVFTNMRSNTISTVCTISPRCFYTCISRTDKPIAVVTNMRCNTISAVSAVGTIIPWESFQTNRSPPAFSCFSTIKVCICNIKVIITNFS